MVILARKYEHFLEYKKSGESLNGDVDDQIVDVHVKGDRTAEVKLTPQEEIKEFALVVFYLSIRGCTAEEVKDIFNSTYFIFTLKRTHNFSI